MVTRRVNEGATVHAPSLIRTANYPGSCSLTLRVTMLITGRRPFNGNPTCQRGSYSTRPIAHPYGQLSGILIADASRHHAHNWPQAIQW